MRKDTTPTNYAERSTVPTPVIGETVSMESGARLTVHSYETPAPLPSWYQQLKPGYELSAIDVEAYAGSNPEGHLDHIQLSDFQLQMPDHTRLRSTLSVKEPTLGNNSLVCGDDIRGWVTFEVPEGKKPRFVVYSTIRAVKKWAIPQ